MNNREIYIEAFVEKIQNDFYTGEFLTKDNKDFKKYHVIQQSICFEAYLTDEELKQTVKAGIDIVEELVRINEEGFDKKTFESAWEKFKDEKDKYSNNLAQVLFVKENFYTEKMQKIQKEICEIRRVGGAYEMFISNPVLEQTIFVVYAASVDLWDEDDVDIRAIYFLIRSIMRMNSIELNECDKIKWRA